MPGCVQRVSHLFYLMEPLETPVKGDTIILIFMYEETKPQIV